MRKEAQGWVSGLYAGQALRFRPPSCLVTAQNIIHALRKLGGSELLIDKAIFVNDPITFLGKKSRRLTTYISTMTLFSPSRCKEQMNQKPNPWRNDHVTHRDRAVSRPYI